MAKGKGRVVPNRNRMRAVSADSDKLLAKIAFQAASHARLNIQRNGQIDTSFMINSVYVTLYRGANTYGNVRASGMLVNRAGQRVWRQVAPGRSPSQNGAIVAVGANYAYWQERKKSFLRKALLQTRGDFDNRIRLG